MQTTEAGVRELKSHLSTYLDRVKAGATIVITERGKPIGRIVPIVQSIEDRLDQLSQAGLIAWSGNQLLPQPPVTRPQGERTLSDFVLEDRE